MDRLSIIDINKLDALHGQIIFAFSLGERERRMDTYWFIPIPKGLRWRQISVHAQIFIVDGIVLGVHKQKDEAITTQLILFATHLRRSYVCKPWHDTGDDCGGSSGESIWQEGRVCKGGVDYQ